MSDLAQPHKQIEEPRLLCEGKIHRLSNTSACRLISVIIPVKNGAANLRELLPRVLSQRCHDNVEIVGVDSGSTDDTVDVLRRFGATIVSIDPLTFNHGLTRNLGARHARGDLFVFVNKLTLPANNHWLANLIAPLDEDPEIAGVYSRCLPRPDLDLLSFRDSLHESPRPAVRWITNWAEYKALSPAALDRFIRFNTVSGAIRPQVFARIPFRDMLLGEDRLWAKEVLEAGLKIRYEPSSIVLHGHSYSYSELLGRSFDVGLGHRVTAEERTTENELLPSIVGSTRDDWRYLEQLGVLDADEPERWRIAAVLRRTAYAVGFWLGANEDRLPADIEALRTLIERIEAGPLTEEARFYVALLRRSFDAGAADRNEKGIQLAENRIVPEICARVREDWHEIERRDQDDPMQLDHARVAAALRRIAEIVGRWLGGNQDRLTGTLRGWFSLVAMTRAGNATPGTGRSAVGSGAQTPAGSDPVLNRQQLPGLDGDACWQADAEALVAIIDGLQAEMLATRAELHTQVEKCNQIIRDLQAEMQMKVEQCNQVIHELEADLRGIPQSRTARAVRFYFAARRNLSHLINRQ